MGIDWVLDGDWNSGIEAVNVRGWIEALPGISLVPPTPTCYTDNGNTTIDYFILTSNLVSRIHAQAM
eukprot:780602-Pyramimonas_sp.AAC.1